jgi:diguanylate cyclase (GGDEF)-like protein
LSYLINKSLSPNQRWAVLVLSILFLALLGIIDYRTGFEISIAFVYLLPIAVVSWFIGRKSGLVISVIGAATWQITNSLAGESFSSAFIPYWNAITRLAFFWVVTWLLTELKLTLDHERALSRTDYLTGALNGRAFNEIAESEIFRSQRYHGPFTLVYLDIDNLKTINDQFGHNTGDTLLQIVASTIQSSVRSSDTVARLGGDEFGILLLETNEAATSRTMSRMQSKLQAEMEARQWPVTFSAGVLICRTTPMHVNEMIRQADELMYTVKNNGKNGIAFSVYEGESQEEIGRNFIA